MMIVEEEEEEEEDDVKPLIILSAKNAHRTDGDGDGERDGRNA